MPRSENLFAALMMMASMACFVLNDTAMKLMAGDVPLFQLLALRGTLTCLLVSVLAWRLGGFSARPDRRDWGLVALRTLAEIGATICFLTALFNMPIADVSAIIQVLPLTVTLGAALVFGERVGWRRWLAIMVGFAGVMLIVRPWSVAFTQWSIYALLAVLCITIRDLSTRRLSAATPSIFVTFITSVAMMAVFGVWQLRAPFVSMELREIALVALASIFIIGAYLSSIMVMRVGEISFVAPFRFTSLLWALVLGWLVFGEWPAPLVLTGSGIVVASGLFMLYREAQIARKKTP
ncbi:MAG: DMT family transporter [Pseudomonadota bacterium]